MKIWLNYINYALITALAKRELSLAAQTGQTVAIELESIKHTKNKGSCEANEG